jgi:hypothetical protein
MTTSSGANGRGHRTIGIPGRRPGRVLFGGNAEQQHGRNAEGEQLVDFRVEFVERALRVARHAVNRSFDAATGGNEQRMNEVAGAE